MKLRKKFLGNGFNPMIVVVYALIFSTLGYIIVSSFAATPPNAPSMYLTPSTQTLPANTTFTVAIRENSGTTAVNAVQANLSYPATLVDFVSIDTTGTAFTTDAQGTGGAGVINIARGNTTPVTGDKLVASVTFKTKATSGAAAVAFTSGTALVESTNFTDILGSLASTGGGTYTVDATAPTVSVTAPANNATLSAGGTTNVTVSASDNSSVSSVDVIIDGTTKATLATAPYTYSWNTTGVAMGAHTISARASDPYGNSTTSATVNVTLADITAPTVSITAPANNATVTGTVNILATAADNSGGTGVAKVEFYVDGALKGTDTATPFAYSWNTTTATDASHTLTAKAYDNATTPNIQTSSTVTVTVDNADHTAPSTPGGLTVSGQTLTSLTLNWTASTDNIGVTGYRIQRNGSTVTTVSGTTLTYTDTGLANGTTYSYSVAAVDANNNFSTAATVNGTTIPLIAGDLNGSGHVDIFDLSLLLSKWNSTTFPSYDLNHNNVVDIFDLSILLSHWG